VHCVPRTPCYYFTEHWIKSLVCNLKPSDVRPILLTIRRYRPTSLCYAWLSSFYQIRLTSFYVKLLTLTLTLQHVTYLSPAAQGRSGSPISMSIKGSYTTSYYWILLTSFLSCTVFSHLDHEPSWPWPWHFIMRHHVSTIATLFCRNVSIFGERLSRFVFHIGLIDTQTCIRLSQCYLLVKC